MINSHVFETFIGPVGLAWQDQQILAVQLPVGSLKNTEAALYRRIPGAVTTHPNCQVRQWTRALARHLQGESQDLSQMPVALSQVSDFSKVVYERLRQIPPGQVVTYQKLADLAGRPRASRAVGTAMSRNPLPLIVPCHRVLASDGQLGGFSALEGTALKQKLLQLEKAQFAPLRAFTWQAHDAATVLASQDARLRRLFARVGPFNLILADDHSPYEALFRAIVFQQLNGRAATSILNRVLALSEGRFPKPTLLLKTPEARLRAQGLSANKLKALRDLAKQTEEGLVPPSFASLRKWSDDELVCRLTQIRGIGEWTVQMMMIFGMGRPDVFPVNDFAIRKAFTQIFKVELSPRELLKFSERWAPHRTVISWYLWRSLDLP
jgi:methylated-DNA-[protein]-cysteine S-methyltransferase